MEAKVKKVMPGRGLGLKSHSKTNIKDEASVS